MLAVINPDLCLATRIILPLNLKVINSVQTIRNRKLRTLVAHALLLSFDRRGKLVSYMYVRDVANEPQCRQRNRANVVVLSSLMSNTRTGK
jgi:hypothetical protein